MNKKDKYISPRAKIYGKVLVDLGFTLEQINDIERIFNISPVLSEVLLNPSVNLKEKHSLIDKIFVDEKANRNLIKLLVDQNRLSLLSQILSSASLQLLSQAKTVTVTLFYVTMPTSSQLKKMEELLRKRLGATNICWEFVEDASLIGGFQIEALGYFYDASVRGQLNEMKKRLLNNSLEV